MSHSYQTEEGASYGLPKTVLGGQVPCPGDSTSFGPLALREGAWTISWCIHSPGLSPHDAMHQVTRTTDSSAV